MVKHRGQVLKDCGELLPLESGHKNRSRMLGMLQQVLLTPELRRDHQLVSVAEEEGRHVVGGGPPVVEDPNCSYSSTKSLIPSMSRR